MQTEMHPGDLLKAKGSSLADFTRRKNMQRRKKWKYRTVCIVAQRWWHRTDKEPHGGIAREILEELRNEVGSFDSEVGKSQVNEF